VLQRPDLFVITTGNPGIGLGHVNRCTSLCDNVRDFFSNIYFVFNASDESLNYPFYPCVYTQDRIQHTLQHARPGDHVILDDYSLTAADANILKKQGLWTIGINDIPADALPSDIIINHLPGVDVQLFQHLKEARLLLGTKYLMLRKPFLDALKVEESPIPENGLFIAMGGTDPARLTVKYLDAALEAGMAPIHIVTSHLNPNLPALKERCNQRVHLHIGIDADSMVSLIRECRYAVVTASTLTLEAMCVRSCIATGYTHANQKLIAASCEQNNTALNAGDLNQADATAVLEHLKQLDPAILRTNQYELMHVANPANFKDILQNRE
jgi:spore coat polysaccharide biosynthesis predicted glycosyltransferase SpsG